MARRRRIVAKSGDETIDPALAVHLNQYEIFRSYVEHEDNLINHRITWSVTIQGFLFAGYAVVIGAYTSVEQAFYFRSPGVAPGLSMDRLSGPNLLAFAAIVVFPVVGALIAFLTIFSALAARAAINQLTQDHQERVLKTKTKDHAELTNILRRQEPFLPRLIGGGAEFSDRKGFRLAIGIPLAFTASWILVALVTARILPGWWNPFI
jgi:hypothetical protein